MKSEKHIVRKFILSSILFFILGTYSWGSSLRQTIPHKPVFDSIQYFCSESAWAQIGEDADYLGDLPIYPDKFDYTLTWYSDQALTQSIKNPKAHPLQDGDVYFVTQSNTKGEESAALKIIASEKDCGCIKDPRFQDQKGKPAYRGYEAFQFDGVRNHKTCGQSMLGANALPLGSIDGYTGSDNAVLVTRGNDPAHLDSGGSPILTIPNLSRTNPNNPYSTHAFRLNRGVDNGGPDGRGNITSMSKNFIAGEVFVFNFSLILANPDHLYEEQPFAQVTLYDMNDNIIQRRCLVSDPDDCIFNNLGTVLYSDWSCMKLNTMDYIGQPVRAEFVTAYCIPTQHYAFMYIDDLYAGNDTEEICASSSFGYAMINSVSPASENCYISDELDEINECSISANANTPGLPIYICGKLDSPISQGPPAKLEDLTLNIIQNNAIVGTITRAEQGFGPNTFCFVVEDADLNVLPYGRFTFDVELDFVLNCGSEYHFYVEDRTSYSLCPIAGCPEMLTVCDIEGNGRSIFDLTEHGDMFYGTQWTVDDVTLTYYTSEEDAHDGHNPIINPKFYENEMAYFQTIYIRLDWDVDGAPKDCYYLVPLDIEVIELPYFESWEDKVTYCYGEDIDYSIGAMPDNIVDLTLVNYKWYKNGVEIPYFGSVYRATEAGEYIVIVSEQGCKIEKKVIITEFDLSIDLGGSEETICTFHENSPYTIAPIVKSKSDADIDVDKIHYQWDTGDTTKDLTVTESGTYTLEVYYEDCLYVASKTVLFTSIPELDTIEDFILCRGDTKSVMLDINHPASDTLDVKWYHDGGLIAEGVEQLDISDAGIYKVVVGEALASDCHEEITFTVDYYYNESCVVPEGISPNNDGYNDNLDLAFLGDKHGIASLHIFNRHGFEVYSKDNYIDEWYGQSKDNKRLPVGVYFYIIKLKNESDDITGNIYLNY